MSQVFNAVHAERLLWLHHLHGQKNMKHMHVCMNGEHRSRLKHNWHEYISACMVTLLRGQNIDWHNYKCWTYVPYCMFRSVLPSYQMHGEFMYIMTGSWVRYFLNAWFIPIFDHNNILMHAWCDFIFIMKSFVKLMNTHFMSRLEGGGGVGGSYIAWWKEVGKWVAGLVIAKAFTLTQWETILPLPWPQWIHRIPVASCWSQ